MSQQVTPFEYFVSKENFRLAWVRVRYHDRPDSRDWVGLKIFSANKDHNLEILRSELKERVFEPSWPSIRYLPKASLTLRPMAVLAIRDRIVFQAIANVIAEFGRAKLSMIENRQSFANVLSDPKFSSFFVPWKIQYKAFQNAFIQAGQSGSRWVAETDMTAFYETIDHQTLFHFLLEEQFLDQETLEHMEKYLPIWSAIRKDTRPVKGVPQGNLASDLLANIFLYKFDQELSIQEYSYLRYVDDIRLLGSTKDDVLKGLIKVDTTLKSYGLLLQSKKTVVRELATLEAETDRLATLLSEIEIRIRKLPSKTGIDPLKEVAVLDVVLVNEDDDEHDSYAHVQNDLINLFWESFSEHQKGHSPNSERHIRFCLYRLQPETKITKKILPFFVEKPWMSEIISFYLSRGTLEQSTIDFLKNVISTHDIYDSIVALAIDILIRHNVSLASLNALFKKWILEDRRHWSLLVSSSIALGNEHSNMSILIRAMASKHAKVRRMAIIQCLRLANNAIEASHIAQKAIVDKDSTVIETLIYLMYNEWGIKISDLPLDIKVLSEYCVAYAKGYDQSLPQTQTNYIRHILKTKYDVDFASQMDFKTLLGNAYEKTADFLWEAENSYYSNPSRYVSQLDLFHEELLYPIMVDILKITSTKEDLAKVEAANRIETLRKNEPNLVAFSGSIGECKKMRANPETHTRFHKQLTHTSKITWQERDRLKKILAGGYQQLISWLESKIAK